MSERTKVEAIAKVIKKKFSNLNATETIKLAYDILEALEKENENESKS